MYNTSKEYKPGNKQMYNTSEEQKPGNKQYKYKCKTQTWKQTVQTHQGNINLEPNSTNINVKQKMYVIL